MGSWKGSVCGWPQGSWPEGGSQLALCVTSWGSPQRWHRAAGPLPEGTDAWVPPQIGRSAGAQTLSGDLCVQPGLSPCWPQWGSARLRGFVSLMGLCGLGTAEMRLPNTRLGGGAAEGGAGEVGCALCPRAVDKTVSWASLAKEGLPHLPPALLTYDFRSSPAPPSKAFLPTTCPPPHFLRTPGAQGSSGADGSGSGRQGSWWS